MIMQIKFFQRGFPWLVIICMLFETGNAVTDDVPDTWFIGCYAFHSNQRGDALHPFRVNQPLTPARCSKACLDQRYHFAVLSEGSQCSCALDLSSMSRVNERDCNLSCPRDLLSKCGGIGAFSVFSTIGPFISSLHVNVFPSKAVVNQVVTIRIKVKIASRVDYPTGLERYRNTSFNRAHVAVSVGRGSNHSIIIRDREGYLSVQHTYPFSGFYSVDVEVNNALSSEAMRNYLQVVSPIPEGLHLRDVSIRTLRPSCTPDDISYEGDSIETMESTSVVTQETLRFLGTVIHGVNVTFEWNFCHLERRTSTPHLNDEACSASVCQSDEQEFQFNQSGLCEVSVTAFNSLGSDSQSIFVAVITPEVRDLSVAVDDCEGKCTFSLSTWYAQSGGSWGFPNPGSSQYPIPPWDIDNQETTTTATTPTPSPTPTPRKPNLPPGTYLENTKVCFHATVYVTTRATISAQIRFGDGESITQGLSETVSFLGSSRFRRNVPLPSNDPYEPNQYGPDQYAGRDSGFQSFTGNGGGNTGREISVCYNRGCVLNLYFSHRYEELGTYNIDIQISNSTYQLAARLDRSIIIVGENGAISRKLQCERVVTSGQATELIAPEAESQTFSWLINRRHDNSDHPSEDPLTSSAQWQRRDEVISTSPLRHTFNEHGIYFIRVNDTGPHSINSAFCLIQVEDVIDDVTISIRPEVRYVIIGDVIYADLHIERGSNFTITWKFGNETVSDNTRYDAPHERTYQFISSVVGCENISLVVENNVSRVQRSGEKAICSEEEIGGLRLTAPKFLEVGQRANITASLSSGSHVRLKVDVTCHVGVHLMTFYHQTGPTTGPETFNFTTAPFPQPGLFRVVVRARNHVTVNRGNRGPRLLVRMNIKVGRHIENVTIQRLVSSDMDDVALNDRDNILIALINGRPDRSGGILYKWMYPNATETSQLNYVILYTASPIVKIRPRCNDQSNCFLNVTVTAGASEAVAYVIVTSSLGYEQYQWPSIRHELTVPLGEDFLVDVDCATHSVDEVSCKVAFSDDKSFVIFSANTTTSLGHVFSTSGLWKITKEVLTSSGPVHRHISYISIQQRLTRLKIKGDRILELDETPSGTWRAVTGVASHLVFQWKIRRHNTSDYVITSTRVTCVREFGFHFKQSGFYDVIVRVFNDVSQMEVSMTVEVRRASTFFQVSTVPTYLGKISMFVLSVNVTQPFTLAVTWSEGEEAESYTQDQLNVINSPSTSNRITDYSMTHLYSTEGRHRFHFSLEWFASDDVITREFSGYCSIYDIRDNPPIVLTLRRNNATEALHEPYHVTIGDVIKVEVRVNELVTSLSWNIRSSDYVINDTVSVTQRVTKFEFSAVTSGGYIINITTNPGNVGVNLHVVALTPITDLILGQPMRNQQFVDHCELQRDDYGQLQCDLIFTARSNGDNITFQFRFERVVNNPTDDDVTIVEVTTTTIPTFGQTTLNNVARLEHTITREGGYNISVIALTIDDHVEKHKVPLMTTYLGSLFYAETLPDVSLPTKHFYLEVGNVTTFTLRKINPEQSLKADWAMGDGTQYNDAGLSIDHVYTSRGTRTMHVAVYNHVGRMHLRPSVHVQERLTKVEVTTQSGNFRYATGHVITFVAKTTPTGAGTIFDWFLSNDNQPTKTYFPNVQHAYYVPGRYLVKVVARNHINFVESFPIELTLIERVSGVDFNGPRVTEVGKIVKMEAIHYGGSDVRSEWNMGDGTEYDDMFVVTHSYERIGVYNVRLVMGNVLDYSTISKEVFVMEKECPLPTVMIPGIGSREHYRSKPVRFEAIVAFDCPQAVGVTYHWTVKPNTRFPFDVIYTGSEQVLHLPSGSLPYGEFEVTVNASITGTILHATSKVYLTVVESRLIARIGGGYKRDVSRDANVTIDASTSYDPDNQVHSNLKFSWECFVLNSPNKPCFKNHTTPRNSPPNPLSSSALRSRPPTSKPYHDVTIYSWFPPDIASEQSVLTFPAFLLVDDADTFIFKVNVSKTGRPTSSNYATFVLSLTSSGSLESVEIDCPLCRESSMIRQMGALISATCDKCIGGIVTYEWKINVVDDDSKSFYKNDASDCAPPDGSGWLSWRTNVTTNASISQEEVADHEENGLPRYRGYNQTTGPGLRGDPYLPELHPDDANFTGNLYPDNQPLFPPSGNIGEGFPPLGGYPPGLENLYEDTGPDSYDSVDDDGEYRATADDQQSNNSTGGWPRQSRNNLPPWANPGLGPPPGFPHPYGGSTLPDNHPPDYTGDRSSPYSSLPSQQPPYPSDHNPTGEGTRSPYPGAGIGSNLRDGSRNLAWEGETGNRDLWSHRGNNPPGGWNGNYNNLPNPYQNRGNGGGYQYNSGSVGSGPPDGHTPTELNTGGGGRFGGNNRPWPPRPGNTGNSILPETNPNEGDTFIDEEVNTALPVKDHYQDMKHTMLPINNLATEGVNGQILIIKPNVLDEGKTYEISVDVTHKTGEVTMQGKASYYLRATRGPSYGECSVVSVDKHNTFRVHCLQWKNEQNARIDTFTSKYEMLYYELSYSLEEQSKMRHLYYGSSYDRMFTLPAAIHPVFIHVKLYNSASAETKVCSFPVNVTRPERIFNQSALDDLNYVYSQSVGNSSKLHHLILRDDESDVLGHVNVMLDSLPTTRDLDDLRRNFTEVNQQLKEITFCLVAAFSSIQSSDIVRRCDVISTLSRVLDLRQTVSMDTITMTTGIVINYVKTLTNVNEAPMNGDVTRWLPLAEEIEHGSAVNDVINDTLLAVGKMTSSLRLITSTSHNDSQVTKAIGRMLKLEENLRNFYLDSTKSKLSYFGPNRIIGGRIRMLAQEATEFLFLNETKSIKIGAEFPYDVISRHNGTLYQSAIAYLDESPFISTNQFTKVDESAMSIWLTDHNNNEYAARDLIQPIKLFLPPRKKQAKEVEFPYSVTREKMSIHKFNATYASNQTMHVEVRVNPSNGRPFTVAVALSDREVLGSNPHNDTSVIVMSTFASKRRRSAKNRESNNTIKFMLEPGKLHSHRTYYVTIWSIDAMTSEQRRRYSKQSIDYDVDVWWSDCYFWDESEVDWNDRGCKVLEDSDIRQTVCSTSHLSTFTSSFMKIAPIFLTRDVAVIVTISALSPCLTTLLSILAIFLVFLAIHRFVLRHRQRGNDAGDDYDVRTRGVGDWLRCWLGTDDRGDSGRVPVILRDNRLGHSQVFEITLQTGNWPGSGTTSLAHVIMYGEEGQYEARELVAPTGREMMRESSKDRHQNGECLFETGSTKTFIATFDKNLGPLWRLSVWHDHTGPRPRWYLDYVIVRDVISGEKWYFPCNSWLALDRGVNRVSVDLRPLQGKPATGQHLAIRARNYLFDFNSVLSIFACARWGALSRPQRIVHALTLCVAILALATSRSCLIFANNFTNELNYFNVESLAWGLVIGALASIILLPAQLALSAMDTLGEFLLVGAFILTPIPAIIRYTKRDERISIMMEDTTSGNAESTYSSLSRAASITKYGGDLYKCANYKPPNHTGGLRKTATVAHELSGLKNVIDDAVPTSNDVVSDWLQLKEWNAGTDSVKADHEATPNPHFEESVCSWLPHHSVSSFDDEIARCMMTSYPSTSVTHDLPDRTIPDSSCYGDCTSSCCHGNDGSCVSNAGHSRQPSDDVMHRLTRNPDNEYYVGVNQQSHLAMDGPVLVPCEKLEPIPRMYSAPLPRQCAYLAWLYYVIICIVGCGVTVYGSANHMEDIDFSVWIETSFFAMFWIVVVIETIAIATLTIFSTARDLLQGSKLTETLQELFPTVDAATVDDHVYKHHAESIEKLTSILEKDGTLDPSEIKLRVSERRRTRYLRNIAPPYDKRGRWKNKKHPLRAVSREMRKASAAKRASCSWLGFLFLLVTLLVVVSLQTSDGGEKQAQSEHIRSWFDDGFVVDDDHVVSVKPRNESYVSFHEISSAKSWKSWFESNLISSSAVGDGISSDDVMLGSINVLNLRRNFDHCVHISSKMEKIVRKSRRCRDGSDEFGDNGTATKFFGISGIEYSITEQFQLDLSERTRLLYKNSSIYKADAVRVRFATYNVITRKYSVANAMTEFNSPISRTSLAIQTTSLHFGKPKRDWLTHCHVVLLIWVALCALSALLNGTEYGALGKTIKAELNKRSSVKTSIFLHLLNFSMWLTVVVYLLASIVTRYNSSRAIELLEKSNHQTPDSASLIEQVIRAEEIARVVLGLWTILLVCKGLNLAVSLHGYNSKITVGITAVCTSARTAFTQILLPFCIFVVIFAMLGCLIFNICFNKHAGLTESLQRAALSSAWLGLAGGPNQIEDGLQYQAGSYVSVLYYFVLFLVTRICFKALIVASYQWTYHESKIPKRCHYDVKGSSAKRKQNNKSSKSSRNAGKIKNTSRTDKKRSNQSQNGTTRRTRSQTRPGHRGVSFKDVWDVNWKQSREFFGVCATTLFCGTIPRFLKAQNPAYESSESGDSMRTISRLKELSFTSYDKKKITDESGYSTSEMPGIYDADCRGSKHSHIPSTADVEVTDEYKLSGDIALSEIELQVNELYTKATALIDDVMNTFCNLSKSPKKLEGERKSLNHDKTNQSEQRVKQIADRLVKLIKSRNQQDDANTVITSSSVSSLCSSNTSSLDRREMTKLKAEMEMEEARERERSVTSKRHFPADVHQPHESPDVAKIIYVQPYHDERTAHARTSDVPDEETTSENLERKILKPRYHVPSTSSSSLDNSESSAISSLTAFNIARHNARSLYRNRDDVPSTSSATSPEIKQLTVEDSMSNTSGSKSSLEENTSSGSSRSGGLWRTLLNGKRRSRKSKARITAGSRGLHRSQTIFIDVKDLPVIGSSTSSRSRRSDVTSQSKSSKRAPCFASAFENSRYQPSFHDNNCTSDSSSSPSTLSGGCRFDQTGNLPGFVPDVDDKSRKIGRNHSDNERHDVSKESSCDASARGRSCPPVLRPAQTNARHCFMHCPPTIEEDESTDASADQEKSAEKVIDIMEEWRTRKKQKNSRHYNPNKFN